MFNTFSKEHYKHNKLGKKLLTEFHVSKKRKRNIYRYIYSFNTSNRDETEKSGGETKI